MEKASAFWKHQVWPQARTPATQAVSCHGTQPRKPVSLLTRKVRSSGVRTARSQGQVKRWTLPHVLLWPRDGRKVDTEGKKARQREVDEEEAQKMRTLVAAMREQLNCYEVFRCLAFPKATI